MDYDSNQIKKNLREKLKKFPLYKDEHWILVHVDKGVYLSYAQIWNRSENMDKTRFDLEIKGSICYILDFQIEKKERRKRYGNLLYNLIESFCAEQFNCKTFNTTPSGLAKDHLFWEKQGFKYLNAIVVEKVSA